MQNDKRDDDLGREIIRSWLNRGEYDKVFEARETAYLLFGGIVLASIVLCFLFHALGMSLLNNPVETGLYENRV